MMRFLLCLAAILASCDGSALAADLSGQPGACHSKGARGGTTPPVLSPKTGVNSSVSAISNLTPEALTKPIASKTATTKSWLVITPRLPERSQPLANTLAPAAPTFVSATGFRQTSRPLAGVQAIASVSRQVLTTVARTAGRLARVTAYWACEGDYYTRHGIAATGVHLHDGHCAVDPNIIPYGSVVNVPGVGSFLAVDTGSAVVMRTAARQGGHNSAERGAIVIDLYFANRAAGERFASRDAKWTAINWWTPSSTASQAQVARSLFAEEDWSRIQSKQL